MAAQVRVRAVQAPDWTVGDVAAALGVAPRTVCGWMDRGLLKGYRLAVSTHRRFRPADVLAFARRHGMPVPASLEAAAGVG